MRSFGLSSLRLSIERNIAVIGFVIIFFCVGGILYLQAVSIHNQQVTSAHRSKSVAQTQEQIKQQNAEIIKLQLQVKESAKQTQGLVLCIGEFFEQSGTIRSSSSIADLHTCSINEAAFAATSSSSSSKTAQPSSSVSAKPSVATKSVSGSSQSSSSATEPLTRSSPPTQQTERSITSFLQQALSPLTDLVNNMPLL